MEQQVVSQCLPCTSTIGPKLNWDNVNKPQYLICIFGILSTVCAVVQIVTYAVYLRLSAVSGAIDYIWTFTCFGCLNFIYIWHNCRLILMLWKSRYSRRSIASSNVWFYSALIYLIGNVVQAFWFLYLRDVVPDVVSIISLLLCVMFFSLGSRRLHKLKHQHTKPEIPINEI